MRGNRNNVGLGEHVLEHFIVVEEPIHVDGWRVAFVHVSRSKITGCYGARRDRDEQQDVCKEPAKADGLFSNPCADDSAKRSKKQTSC
ncbi:hypothetical protein AYI69_g9113 [Smittium culicis]|uniref:Uncharacterized protein n=1 Tax=Smittium culicis TaxID=133412 RepID=A0A1R1XEZ2_9FUNG|nr:hypothetical protein AYI69_g9113 [Smittium culicis]